MRGLIVLAAVVLLFVVVGWVTFSDSPGESSINLNKEAIRQDTAEIISQGNELIDEVQDTLETPDESPD
jgi:hypothetical protein